MKKTSINYRLTVLWALNESVLGGFLHAIHMPFTGIVVGGIAVAIICLFALYNATPFTSICQAATSVLLVKFLISPYTPFTAYIAVLFQSIMGALLFSLFVYKAWVVIVFSILSMAESAIQKILVLTLLFSKQLWVSINLYAESVLQPFGLATSSFSSALIIGYVGIYLLWGIVLGFIIVKLPAMINRRKDTVHAILLGNFEQNISLKKVKSKKGFYLKMAFALVIISFVFYYTQSAFIIFRSLFIIGCLYFLLPLAIKLLSNKWKIKDSSTAQLINDVVHLNNDASKVWSYCNTYYKGVAVFYQFIILLFSIAIYSKDE